jgi:hypothetical protein
MTRRQGSASKCDAGMFGTICSVHTFSMTYAMHAMYSITVHAKHDVNADMDAAGHGKRDLERPRQIDMSNKQTCLIN